MCCLILLFVIYILVSCKSRWFLALAKGFNAGMPQQIKGSNLGMIQFNSKAIVLGISESPVSLPASCYNKMSGNPVCRLFERRIRKMVNSEKQKMFLRAAIAFGLFRFYDLAPVMSAKSLRAAHRVATQTE